MTEQPATSRTETPMAEQRFTVGDQITVVVTGEMTGITPDGTLTVQYPSSLGACETHVELEDTSVVVMHERDADKATPVLIEERDSARAEVERLRAERADGDIPDLLAEVLRLRDRLATATNALYWVQYQLSKHTDYGGDIQDAHDTARDAYRRITSDGTEAGQ